MTQIKIKKMLLQILLLIPLIGSMLLLPINEDKLKMKQIANNHISYQDTRQTSRTRNHLYLAYL